MIQKIFISIWHIFELSIPDYHVLCIYMQHSCHIHIHKMSCTDPQPSLKSNICWCHTKYKIYSHSLLLQLFFRSYGTHLHNTYNTRSTVYISNALVFRVWKWCRGFCISWNMNSDGGGGWCTQWERKNPLRSWWCSR